jgi:hypothetical protein
MSINFDVSEILLINTAFAFINRIGRQSFQIKAYLRECLCRISNSEPGLEYLAQGSEYPVWNAAVVFESTGVSEVFDEHKAPQP